MPAAAPSSLSARTFSTSPFIWAVASEMEPPDAIVVFENWVTNWRGEKKVSESAGRGRAGVRA